METRREPTGGIVTAWREVWRMSMSDLRAASAAASASVGWVSVVAETLDAGEGPRPALERAGERHVGASKREHAVRRAIETVAVD